MVQEELWIAELTKFVDHVVQLRIEAVEEWLSMNTTRYPAEHADIQNLNRTARNMIIDMRSNVQICTLQCADCQLSCIHRRHHDGRHDCQTSHKCVHCCQFEDHGDELCGLPCVQIRPQGCV